MLLIARRMRVPACLALIAFASTMCTKVSEIPDADYRNIDPDKGAYTIKTTAGKSIYTDRFTVTENGLLIEAVIYNAQRQSVAPYEIAFEDIASMSRHEADVSKTIGVAVGALAVVGMFVGFFWLLGESWSTTGEL